MSVESNPHLRGLFNYIRKGLLEILQMFAPPVAQHPPVDRFLLVIEASQSHWETLHSIGLLWMNDEPATQTSTWQHTALTRDKHECLRRYSKLQIQQARADPCPRPRNHWDRKSGKIAALVLNFGTKWRWVVSITPQPLYPQGRRPINPFKTTVAGAQFCSGLFGEENSLFTCSRTA